MDFLGRYLEAQLLILSNSTGIPLDQSKFVFCCLIAYPLGFLFSLIPCKNTSLRHLSGMLGGMWFAYFIFKEQILNSLVSSAVVFMMLQTLPRTQVHKYVFAFMMLCITREKSTLIFMRHIWQSHISNMVLTIKLITLAFDYHDGMKPADTLTSYQKNMQLNRLPNLLEYYGYVYFFGGFLAGPAFNLKEYLDFIDGSLFKSAPGGKMPSSVVPSFTKLFYTLLVGIGVGAQMMYPLAYAKTQEFQTMTSFLYRCGYIWLGAFLQRWPYYFAWFISEGSCIMAGIGFNEYVNGKATWDRATNVRILPLEFGQSFRDVTENWNIRTDRWLKHYIYERVPSNGVALTFLTSAVWHGFYPGYYLSFMTAAVVTQVARGIRRTVRPRFMEDDDKTPKSTKVYYDMVCLLSTSFILNYTMVPFCLLGWSDSIAAWGSVFFIGHIIVATGYFIPMIMRPPKKRPTETKKTH